MTAMKQIIFLGGILLTVTDSLFPGKVVLCSSLKQRGPPRGAGRHLMARPAAPSAAGARRGLAGLALLALLVVATASHAGPAGALTAAATPRRGLQRFFLIKEKPEDIAASKNEPKLTEEENREKHEIEIAEASPISHVPCARSPLGIIVPGGTPRSKRSPRAAPVPRRVH